MQIDKLIRFHTINELQSSPDVLHTDLKNDANEYSQPMSLKIRFNESSESSDLAELKKQLKSSDDQKKTERSKKHEKKSNCSHIDAVTIYDEIGIKGELYFKALEETKSTVKKTREIKETIDDPDSRDQKKYTECVSLLRYKLLLETATVKLVKSRDNFSCKPIFNTGVKQNGTIKI